jgi:hypothetical protein
VDFCHFVNTSLFSLKKTWYEAVFHSQWCSAGRYGGSDYEGGTVLCNPQVSSAVSLICIGWTNKITAHTKNTIDYQNPFFRTRGFDCAFQFDKLWRAALC